MSSNTGITIVKRLNGAFEIRTCTGGQGSDDWKEMKILKSVNNLEKALIIASEKETEYGIDYVQEKRSDKIRIVSLDKNNNTLDISVCSVELTSNRKFCEGLQGILRNLIEKVQQEGGLIEISRKGE